MALFLPLVCGTGALVSALGVQHTAQVISSASTQTLRALVGELRAQIGRAIDPATALLELRRMQELAEDRSLSQRLALLPSFADALAKSPTFTAYQVAGRRDDLFIVARAMGPRGPVLPDLPPRASLVVLAIEPGRRVGKKLVFDADLRQLSATQMALPPGFVLRERPWVRLAQGATRPVIAPVHRFAFDGQMGVTLSLSTPGGGAVGAALPLSGLAELLTRYRITPGTQLALVTPGGSVLATPAMQGMDQLSQNGQGAVVMPTLSQLGMPALAALAPRLKEAGARPGAINQAPGFSRFRMAGQVWRGAVVGLPSPLQGGNTVLLMALPERELLVEARQLARDGGLATLLVLLLAVPVVVLVSRQLSASLRRLAAQAEAIQGFELEGHAVPRSRITEVDALVVAFNGMRATIRRFLHISALLAAEENVDRLLEQLLNESVQVSGACGGTLVVPPDQRLEQGDVGAPEGDAAAERLALPLLSRRGEGLGELVLHFAEPPEPARVAFCRALSGNAAVALETRGLIAAQKALFESFIQLIADAIDAKSPYTGGHCARVPELARLLADAACEARSGPYADFQLTELDREALHLASWLHDCGKVTTPEYVVDKATKLETLHDRIHEVRMRFELLKAAAETDHWRAVAEGGDRQGLQADLERSWAELDADFAFVADCNLGGEFMAPERIDRLQAIAARRWRRTLDDRAGVSGDELRRRQREPEQPLPAWEPLLADRPHHRIERLPQQRLPRDNPWGITMAEPELLYDRGELHNLTISRGTLNNEERYKINEHIIQTIRMLAALPFPDHLAAVPEIATGHHETTDGRGYPRGLTAEQMSPLARMMAIADVFEALTAADRPYKSGKPLSVALAILVTMASERHLDRELLELFLEAGVWRTYAERFLGPDQCDAVDLEALLARLRG
ncbi:HD domain-containing phosphohydrolase [Vulcanococcus limneticus]|uniref:HD domain-containing phosphohydrolase n=1 Tax=Vulcanococcus limneticus TaxID=2170428 RepID=UPI00398BF364